MAIVINNDLTRGLRGRVGKWFVFRMVRGKTIASHAPRKPDPLKQSAAQRQTRTTFKEAAAWAARILLDPAKKRYFADLAKIKALPNAYTAAVQEYMRQSSAHKIDHHVGHSDNTITENVTSEIRLAVRDSSPEHTSSIPDTIQYVSIHSSTLPRTIRYQRTSTVRPARRGWEVCDTSASD